MRAVLLFVALALPLLFVVKIPTTFRCKALVDGRAEAHLVYPSAERVSYESTEGQRDPLLMQLSLPRDLVVHERQSVRDRALRVGASAAKVDRHLVIGSPRTNARRSAIPGVRRRIAVLGQLRREPAIGRRPSVAVA